MATTDREIAAVVFDLDGTLVDTHNDILHSVMVALEDQGITKYTPQDLHKFLGYPLAELYSEIVPDGDAKGLQRFVHIYRANYCDHCTDTSKLYPGAIETLDALKNKLLAVATAKPTWSAVQILDGLGQAHRFAHIVGSEHHPPKPDPALLLHVASLLGLDAENCAMVGDTNRDILAAKAAGMKSIAVTWGAWNKEQLATCEPDAMVDSFEQIPAMVKHR